MKSIFISGATGYLGRKLAIRLAGEGRRLHALYRSEEKIRDLKHDNILFFKGSLSDPESLERAMKGCSEAYHLASHVASWARDPGIYYKQNVEGTVQVLESAMKQGVQKLVFASTAGVFGPSNDSPNTEEKQFNGHHFTHYDQSKAFAEKKVIEYVNKGLHAVIANPTRVYGPGTLSQSNALTAMIARYLAGKWKIMPGNGSSIGNYVYVEDVVDCLMLAMKKGRTGEQYIAGGENLTFNDIFEIVSRVSGIHHRLYRVPIDLIHAASVLLVAAAWLGGGIPASAPSFVKRYRRHWAVSSEKAKKELGYRPISFEEGIQKTVKWLRN